MTTAASGFLEALSAGNGATALSMTTSSAEDFACEMFMENGREAAIEAPEVLVVEVSDTTATAEVSYVHSWANYAGVPADVSMTLHLERQGDEWLVVLPETYQLLIEFNAPAVAVATIERDAKSGSTSPTCDVPVVGGIVDIPALPGAYNVTYTDPTGIMDYFNMISIALVGGADPYVIGQPGAVTSLSLLDLDQAVAGDVSFMILACTTTLYERPAVCPAELEGAQLLEEDGQPPTDGAVYWWPITLDRVWTDDEETWLFSTNTEEICLSRDGVPFYLDVAYSGHFALDDDGEIVAIVDL